MKKVIEWFKRSNRLKHLAGGFIIGLGAGSLYSAVFTSMVAGGCLEYKDRAWGGKWDWIDLGLTVAGGVLGGATYLIVC